MTHSRTKTCVSLVLNIAIAVLVAGAVVAMITLGGDELAADGVGAFQFFTVDSNILVAVAAVVCAIYQVRILQGKATALPRWAQVLKLAGTAAVALTFLVVLCFLVPLADMPIAAMYGGSNFVLHLVSPLCAVAAYVFLDGMQRASATSLIWCGLPTLAYEVYYGITAFSHMQGGQVPLQYDWYHFLAAGPAMAAVIAPLFLAITLITALALNRLARC